ncbi:MAG: cysteine desulfurase [Geminicoccaceae bacterium]|nr:cysteine desulfurase [Geminicoccaceae bacterium]MCX8101661.1 cysteine desulfurase [Geminicoccaceae bacterium]MDW8371675.1 cysteine desulfurase [Geminicoccaceae bacterium]
MSARPARRGDRVPALDVEAIRAQFPILATRMRGRPLVYLDSAASAQKPRAVIEALSRFYERDYANIHRGVYELSQRASALHDAARQKVARFLGAADAREIVFVRNATEGVNLVAHAFLEPRLGPGDEILLTEMEHHANIVPWQLVAGRRGAKVVPVPITEAGELRLEDIAERIGPRTKMLAVTWVSNVLGTVNPVHEIAALARRRGVPFLVDAAQAAPHLAIDVRALGADFLVFSAHKTYGPSGVGVLWGRAELLDAMPPWQGGGDMIERVSFAGTTFNEIPFRFEAGTPDIAGIHATGAALDWLEAVGLDAVHAHEEALVAQALERLSRVRGLRVLGRPRARAAVVAFTIDGLHPQDVGTLLDLDGIAIRTGHHCAMPLHERFGLPASARASMGVYTTPQEIDALGCALERIVARFA